MTIPEAVSTAIIGLIAGAVGSLVAPLSLLASSVLALADPPLTAR